jgi:hypothetical protein
MPLSTTAIQRVVYGFDRKAKQLVEDNASLPPDHPDMKIIRCYYSSSLPEKKAFWDQLVSALEDTPLLTVFAARR